MANLNDLKKVGEELVPIFQELFDLIKTDAEKPNKQPEQAVVQRLKKLVSEANTPTQASLAERAETIGAMRTALTEVLMKAASSNQPLPETTIRIIQTQRNALRNAFGLLLVVTVFEDIPQLLSATKIDQISIQLEKADKEIAERRKAKKILDTTINIAITASKIATKLT